jgi:hypothetical protein
VSLKSTLLKDLNVFYAEKLGGSGRWIMLDSGDQGGGGLFIFLFSFVCLLFSV